MRLEFLISVHEESKVQVDDCEQNQVRIQKNYIDYVSWVLN